MLVARDIAAAGGVAETAQVDALDEKAVEAHLSTVVERAGRVDISFNAIGPGPTPGRAPLTELAGDAFARPIAFYTSSNFITATAAARRMSGQGSGVIVTLTAVPGRMPANLLGGSAPAWAAVEAFSRSLALEVGPAGIRVVCLRPHAIPETPLIQENFATAAQAAGVSARPVPGDPRTGHAAQAAPDPRRSRRHRRLHRLRPRRCHDRDRRQPQRRQHHRLITFRREPGGRRASLAPGMTLRGRAPAGSRRAGGCPAGRRGVQRRWWSHAIEPRVAPGETERPPQ